MKPLKPYQDDCFNVHKSAVDSKQRGERKNRLLKLNPSVEIQYKAFSQNFKKNTLHQQNADPNLAKSREDLLTLYGYQRKVIRSVREKIKKQQIRTIITTCQNCTVDTANTLDHILPKSDFPEFIVNPWNLFPCCSTCNSYKLDTIEKGECGRFLNLYLDELPNVQYLFVRVIKNMNGDIDFTFELKNHGNTIPNDLYSVLEYHYNNLHLFDRFKLKSIEYLSELESKILAFKNSLPMEVIVSSLMTAIEDEKEAYGYNHWKCILEQELINNDLFMEKLR